MIIKKVEPDIDWTLKVVAEDGRRGVFDVKPYLDFEAFFDLKSEAEFRKVSCGGYFLEWESGADLSADTIEAHWNIIEEKVSA